MSADCPNRDKCRHCGESGDFAPSCSRPWKQVTATTVSAPGGDFPPLLPAAPPVMAGPSGVSITPAPSGSPVPPGVQATDPSLGVPSPTAGAPVLDSINHAVEEVYDTALDSASSTTDDPSTADLDSVASDPRKSLRNVASNVDSVAPHHHSGWWWRHPIPC